MKKFASGMILAWPGRGLPAECHMIVAVVLHYGHTSARNFERHMKNMLMFHGLTLGWKAGKRFSNSDRDNRDEDPPNLVHHRRRLLWLVNDLRAYTHRGNGGAEQLMDTRMPAWAAQPRGASSDIFSKTRYKQELGSP
ncbi:hypothetical protein F5Y10DRAFT_108412 [Nemania abortiva]|nr:hypothetical protein F5Y10DRAFT_108412 [Nemania abortiva]